MFRILVAECKQEVSSFNPVPSRYRDFVVRTGDDFFAWHASGREEVGGVLAALEESGCCQPVPTYSAQAITSGGELGASDCERLAGEFRAALRRGRPADGALFVLHGAMAADGECDPEGCLLEQARAILGEEIPIVVSLDLHAVVTDRMLSQADAVVAYHTYPHVDFFETGARAARLLVRILSGNARPVTARARIPLLARGDQLITRTGSFGDVIREAVSFEARAGGLSAAVFVGNPFTDVPELRSNSLAVSDGDPAVAARCAADLAGRMWDRREGLRASLTGVAEAVRLAARTRGTAVLVDAADATSSGAPGDSNAILREAVDSGFAGSVLAPVVDPGAVADAFEAGVGGTVRTSLGGAMDPARFRPLPVEARVRLLSDGEFRSESFGSSWHAGPTAVLQFGRRVAVVTSRSVNLYDRALFLAHGQDPRRFDLVVVKSPHCEPRMYREWCGRLINVDAPGATSADLRSLGHSRCPRPVFPLDEVAEYRPAVEIYQRDGRAP